MCRYGLAPGKQGVEACHAYTIQLHFVKPGLNFLGLGFDKSRFRGDTLAYKVQRNVLLNLSKIFTQTHTYYLFYSEY